MEPGSTGKSRTVRYAATSTITPNTSGTRPTYCRNGHQRTPENTYRRPDGYIQCRPCKMLSNLRYNTSEKGIEATLRKHYRYNNSLAGYWRIQKFSLERQRAAIEAKLDALAEEEAECRTRLESLTQTR